MEHKNNKAKDFVKALLEVDKIKQLELVDDQGVLVSTHTCDVLDVITSSLQKNFGSLKRASTCLDFYTIIIGTILHDVSKGSLRLDENKEKSHSHMMLNHPEEIEAEVKEILTEVEKKTGYKLKANIKKAITHVVVSHHGRWGKVRPETREAKVVHDGDMYSAKYHRITPIGADTIIELMEKGKTKEEIAKELGCTEVIVKDRLKKAKDEMVLKSDKQLLDYYKNYGQIAIGDDLFTRRIKETATLLKKYNANGMNKLILNNKLITFVVDNKIFL